MKHAEAGEGRRGKIRGNFLPTKVVRIANPGVSELVSANSQSRDERSPVRCGPDDDDREEVKPALRSAPTPSFSPAVRANAKVAVVRCRGFGAEVHAGLAKAFDLLGGIGGLVRGKTVTVKLNLTGTQFDKVFNRPVGDTYMTHPDSALALGKLLFQAGARRVRFVESNQRMEPLEQTVADGGWDVKAFEAHGPVEWENTRNLGRYKQYAHFKVPSGGHLLSSFEFNKAYEETDILVSLCKLKNHQPS